MGDENEILSVCESCSPGTSPSTPRAHVELLTWSGTSAITKIPIAAATTAVVVVVRRWRKAIRRNFFMHTLGGKFACPATQGVFGNADTRPPLLKKTCCERLLLDSAIKNR